MAMETPVAFFDLDGTLIPGSANIPLAKAAFREGMVSYRDLAYDLRDGILFVLSGASDARSHKVRDRILSAVAGHSASEIEALSDGFLDELVLSLRPQMRQAIDDHHDRGERCYVLSASPTEIVERFADRAGLDGGYGTTAARDAEGRYTGELDGPFCYREGKAQVLREIADEQGLDLARCYAYSDSASDLPMLEAVGHPVAVHPEPGLRHVAQERGWPIIETSPYHRVSLVSPRDWARLATSLVAQGARASRRLLPHSA